MNTTLAARILADDFANVRVLVNGRIGKIVGASGEFEVSYVDVMLEDGRVIKAPADAVEEVPHHG